MTNRRLFPILIAVLATVPGILLRLAGVEPAPPVAALISGTAILGASFLLLWACDAAQSDISQALALAVVALIAVLPEYAVDMYFTWQAGQYPAGNYAHYAIANMTGANRLLIGVAWAAIAVLYFARHRRDVRIEKARRTELFFLGLATAYAFVIPIKGSLAWYDGLVFLCIYACYIAIAGRRPCAECEVEGPAEVLAKLPASRRRTATAILFLFAAGAILANAEPFCEGLIGTGKALKVSEFLLVQWLAPIASEAPEFIVALVFAWRGQACMALGSLLSAKLNQWTLLVGMIPGVFGVAHRGFDHPIPMSNFQMQEILLTAAQSLLAIALLAGMRLSIGGALLLFGLFIGQLVMPGLAAAHPGAAFGLSPEQMHPAFTALYITAAVTLFLQRPRPLFQLRTGVQLAEPVALLDFPRQSQTTPAFKTPHCVKCRWRLAGVEAGLFSEAAALR